VLAAAEDGGYSFLGLELFLALASTGGGARAEVYLTAIGEATVCRLLAAAVADQDPLGLLGGELADVGVGGRDGVGVESPVQEVGRCGGEGVDRVLVLARLVEPAGGSCPVLQR
jgi:hypothetical protein